MKVFGGCENKTGGFRLPTEDCENAQRYTLTLNGLRTGVIGLGKVEHLDQLLETFHRVDAADEERFIALAQRGLDLLKADASLRAMHGQPLI